LPLATSARSLRDVLHVREQLAQARVLGRWQLLALQRRDVLPQAPDTE
jgi:hypothetical protein